MINLKVLKNKKSMNKHMVKKRIRQPLLMFYYLEQFFPVPVRLFRYWQEQER